jgi:para-aminobenzoate synthetase component 1
VDGFDTPICVPPGHAGGSLIELERLEWRTGEPGEPAELLVGFLAQHGLSGEPAAQDGDTSVVLLLGAAACARIGQVPDGPPSPVPDVPDLVAVAVRGNAKVPPPRPPVVGEWRTTWSDAEHATAVAAVRAAIARGDVYQANVVGHRSAPHRSHPADVARSVASIRARYAGVLTGEGWAVGCASPEQLVHVDGSRITTEPIKGTRRVAPGSLEELRASTKDRAEHVMIVDLERNDLARLAVTGSVEVEVLYDVAEWSGLWHASSTVAAELTPGVDVGAVLRALVPGGSITGAPKRAACGLLSSLEPVGRGPAMGAFGVVWPGGLDLGLTIRSVGVDADRVHLWAGGGITWGSDPDEEVAEAHAKAGPVLRVLGSSSA